MNHNCGNNCMIRRGLLVMALVMVIVCAGVNAMVIPTPWWKSYFGEVSIDGEPAPTGTVVDTYDPDGAHCGTFTVSIEGLYGFMPVYGDDDTSTEVDEGCEAGDSVLFYVNGQSADVVVVSGSLEWFDTEIAEIDLMVNSTSCCNHDGIRGDVNYDSSNPNIGDLTYLVAYLFSGGEVPPCQDEADMQTDGSGAINIGDLTYLVAYLFSGGAEPPECPNVGSVLTLTTPTGGDEWLVGSLQSIDWICTDPVGVGPVNLYYSQDGFMTDSQLIIASLPNDVSVSYPWIVTCEPDSTVWIRVWGTLQDVYATTDSFIVAGVTVTSPNGGEVWAVGSSADVTWSSVGSIDAVDIAYSVNNGANWINLTLDEVNDETYTLIEVPNLTCDGLALVRVRDNVTSLGSDVSDATFTIAGVIITAPNGGENWANGTTHDITWNEIPFVWYPLELQYSLDGIDGIYSPIPGANNITPGTEVYSWTLDALTDANLAPSSSCWIRIRETGSGTIWDKNDAPFAITNVAPVIDAGVDQIAAGDDANFTVTVSDADGGIQPILSWAITSIDQPTVPLGVVDNGDGTYEVTYTYHSSDDGEVLTVEFTAFDGMATHVDSVDIAVIP